MVKIFDNIFNKPKKEIPDFESHEKVSQIWNLFPYVLNSDEALAQRASKTINRILRSKTGYSNKDLYKSLRHVSLKPNQLEMLLRLEQDEMESLLCIASLNGNGYVREEALKGLALRPTDFSFPFILFRLADWVPEIATVAVDIIEKQLDSSKPDLLIKHHRVIEWLIKVERSDLFGIYSKIKAKLFDFKNVPQLVANIESYQGGDRYYIYSNLIDYELLSELAIKKMLADRDYAIRFLAVRKLDLRNKPEVLRQFLQDKSQKIRLRALSNVDKYNSSEFSSIIKDLIFDSNAQVRGQARKLNAEWTNEDYYKLYREALAHKPRQGAILGLAEFGKPSDTILVLPFLQSEKSTIRSSTIYALNKLAHTEALEYALAGLEDVSNKVKKTSMNVIIEHRSSSVLARIRETYDNGDSSTQRFVLKTISEFGGWEIAGDFLGGLKAPNESVRTTASALFNGWYNYSRSLGMAIKQSDIDYVMRVYNTLNLEELKLPKDVQANVKMIPFIFEPLEM